MEHVRKPAAAPSLHPASVPQIQPQIQSQLRRPLPLPAAPGPLQRKTADLGRAVTALTTTPVTAQRQAARPVLRAAELSAQAAAALTDQRASLQREAAGLGPPLPLGALQAARERQAAPTRATARPQSPGEWVTVMQQQAERLDGARLSSAQQGQFAALQRQVAQTLSHSYRQDRQPAAARHAEYAAHLVALQRHPQSAQVARVVLTQIPAGERPALQSAVDDLGRQQAALRQQDENTLRLYSVQRQLAELDQAAAQPVMQRIQARRGAGNPLPDQVQRQLELGLNHDLGTVRIHDDAEADLLAKGVNAVAFTSGRDVYFQAGRYQPNTQTGLELLAHELTHVKQQALGQVGPGVDPDAALEQEAQQTGRRLAQTMPSGKSLLPPAPHLNGPHAPGVYSTAAAVQRAQAGTVSAALYHPFASLAQQATIQRLDWNPLHAAQNGLNWAADQGKAAIASGLRLIPGYKELCLTFGKDLVTGKAMTQNPNAILDALAGWVPGPLKEMIRVVRQQNLMPKAWAWFQGELGKLNLGGALSEIAAATGRADLGGAKAALMTRVNGLKSLVLGSARQIAGIALSAIEAGLGPVGKRVMAQLRKSGDVIMQIIRDPAKFAGNLLSALRQGFTQFSTNAGKWLKNGLGQWLTGASGFAFPTTLDVGGVFMTALSIMGLTYQAMRGRLVAQLGAGGAQKVAAAEQAGGTLTSLSKGLHTSPELLSHQAAVGKDVVDGLKTEVSQSLVTAGAAKVASMLIPGGAFVQAILTAFRTVQTLISQSAQIMGVITTALGSVGAIAAGQVGAAAGFIERTIGGSIPIVLTFLGKVIGLGNFGGRIKATVMRMRARLDAVLDRIIARVKGLIGKVTGKGKPEATPQANATPVTASNDKKATLAAGVKAIRPQFQALVRRHAPVKELKGQLSAWQTQQGLARVWMTRETGQFALRAKVNPEETVGTAMTPGDTDLRLAARQAVERLMTSPAVQARAQQFAQQANQLATQGNTPGASGHPFMIRSGLDTLALLVYSRQTKVTPERPISGLDKRPPGKSETYFDYGNGLNAQHGQWQAGTNTYVRKMGTYSDIASMMDKIKASTGLSDAEIATSVVRFIRSGTLSSKYNAQERQQLAALRHLLTYSESMRSPQNTAHSMMVLDRIASGQTDWKTGLQELPMHIRGAAGAKRGLELLDQKVENLSPKAAEMLRKFMPSIETLRQKEADLIRNWMDTMKTKGDSLFKDKADMSSFILTNMNSFYGGKS